MVKSATNSSCLVSFCYAVFNSIANYSYRVLLERDKSGYIFFNEISLLRNGL